MSLYNPFVPEPLESRRLFAGSAAAPGAAVTTPPATDVASSAPAPNAVADAARLDVSGLPAFAPAGRPATFTVTARDAAGDVAAGYRGTVQFGATDARAGLPAAYTFTADDAGVRTFTATLRTPGAHALSAADPSAGLAGSLQARVHAGSPQVTVPLPDRRDNAADPVRGLLYVTTDGGTVERYDPVAGVLLPPVRVAADPLTGIDVTPDGARAYVGNAAPADLTAWLGQVDLATGAVTRLPYPVNDTVPNTSRAESGPWDVVVPATGRVLFSSHAAWGPVREYDPSTGRITPRMDYRYGRAEQNTWLNRGADRGLVYITEAYTTAHDRGTYDAATDSFPVQRSHLATDKGAVSRDGRWIAAGGQILDRGLNVVRTLFPAGRYQEFDPVRDRLYQATEGGQVTVYDTNTWAPLYQFALAEPVEGPNQFTDHRELTVSDDGRWLYANAASGVGVYPLIARPVITSQAATLAPGGQLSVTVAARGPDGATDAGYRGTVRVTSTDPAAVLPADQPFAADDGGVRSFPVELRTPGRHTVTVTDAATGMATALYDVLVTGTVLDADGALTVVGGWSHDTVGLSAADGGGSVRLSVNGAVTTYPAAAVRRIEVLTLGGGDSVTVGVGAPGGLVDLGDGDDVVTAAAADGQRTLAVLGGGGDDAATFHAGGSQRLSFAGGDGADRIAMVGTPAAESVHVTAGGTTFGPVWFATSGVESTTVDAAGGDDSVTTSGLAAPGGYGLKGGDGHDDFRLGGGGGQYGATYYRVGVDGGPGDDRLALAAATHINWNYASFTGGPGTDALTVTGSGVDTRYHVSGSAATTDRASSLYDASVEAVTVNGTRMGEEFSVSGTSSVPVTVNAGGGPDLFAFTTGSAAVPPVLNGQGGDDRLTFGPLTFGPGGPGAARFDGGPGTDAVEFTAGGARVALAVGAADVNDGTRRVFDLSVEAITLTGGTGSDSFAVVPRAGTTVTVAGGSPAAPTAPGDTLRVDAAGTAGATVTRAAAAGAGSYRFADRQPVTFSGIETLPDVAGAAAVVGDGSAQRSRVIGLTVAFDRPVVPDAGAFVVAGRGGAAGGTAVTWSNPLGDGRTWVLAFAGTAVVAGSLPDGVYDLTVVAGRVRDAATGQPATAADYGFAFHRLFGDGNGSKNVNNADYLLFRTAFGKPSTDPAYNPAFDLDGNGTVNNADYLQFRARFGRTLEY